MDSHLFRIFQMQIWTQCDAAIQSYDAIGANLVNMEAAQIAARAELSQLYGMSSEEMSGRAIEIAMRPALPVWHSVQAMLTAVANVSKTLWGQGGKFEVERQPLRDALGVTPTSVLRATSMRTTSTTSMSALMVGGKPPPSTTTLT